MEIRQNATGSIEYVRPIAIGGYTADPWVLYHENKSALEDETLTARLKEFCAAVDPQTNPTLFPEWLCDKYGYVYCMSVEVIFDVNEVLCDFDEAVYEAERQNKEARDEHPELPAEVTP